MVDERARRIVRAVFEEAWNEGRVTALQELVAPEVTFHYRGTTFPTNLSDLGQLIAAWRAAFPDLHLDVRSIVADGDEIAVRLRFTGTHLGEWQGIAPTGRHVAMDEMMFLRLDDGLLVEAWEVQDERTLLAQIGEL